MKMLFDFFPLILFFGAYKFYGIYAATAVAIAASVGQVLWVWVRTRKTETTHLVTLFVIVIFGGMTLVFRDDTFIKWKPSIVNWIFAVIVIGSHFIGNKTVIERLLGTKLSMPGAIWTKVNFSWGIFFLISGLLNMYVAFYYRPELPEAVRTDFWVNFKVFGLLGLTLAFSVIQMMLIAKHNTTKDSED